MPSGMSFWQTIKHHVRSGHLRAAGVEMLLAAIALLIAGMILMGANLAEVRKTGLAAKTSEYALQEIAEVDGGILGIELSMRGYALTADPVYAQRYVTRMQLLDKATVRLNAAMAQDAPECNRVKALNDFLRRRKAYFNQLAAIPPDKINLVVAEIKRPQVRDERIAAREILQLLRANEMKRLSDRQASAERQMEQTFVLSSVIVVLGFILAILGLGLMGAIGYFKAQNKHP